MIRKNLLKATIITTVIATLLCTAGCGKKSTNNNAATQPIATVSAETKSVAAKELTKTSLVSFDYKDADGNTYTLEGKAVANESGDATIEVSDNNGNKVTFTGKAKTVDGKLCVSDIAVKDAGTLVKADGSEIKITTGTTVADASESNEGESNTDIAASDDVREEVETAKKEESVIEAAREEVTKAEESVKADDENNNDENNNDKNNDTIIADNGNNGGSENTGNNNTGDSENTGDNGGNTDDNNTSDSNNTPTPSEPEETPTTPADPEPTPAPVNPTPAPEEEKPTPDNSKDDSDNGNNGGYDFPTVEGPNGPMYGADYSVTWMRGMDVNQGADKPCPYELKTVTTRYMYTSSTGFANRTGYYYVASDEYGAEGDIDSFDDLSYQMGKYNCTCREVGEYSCGHVWFCAFDD